MRRLSSMRRSFHLAPPRKKKGKRKKGEEGRKKKGEKTQATIIWNLPLVVWSKYKKKKKRKRRRAEKRFLKKSFLAQAKISSLTSA